MDDTKIIELYFKRNEQAIEETDIKYGKLCNRIAFNILNSIEDSKECVNDTYNGIWNAIPPTKPGNFKAFVCKIERNLSLKRLEFMKREKRSAGIAVSFEELALVLPDERYTQNLTEENVGEIISNFLHSQKQEVRNVFIQRYFFFDSVSEIAKRFSFTESKVKNMLFRTRNKLKDYLIKEGVTI